MTNPAVFVVPLFVGFLTLCVILLVYFGWKTHKARVAAWAEFASRHDMQAKGLWAQGEYEGYPLLVETQNRGSGKNSYTVTVLQLSTRGALPEDFSLDREGFGDKVLKFFGKKDAEIGDESFDREFDLKNLSPATAKVLRNRAVQQHLYEVVSQYWAFRILGGCIQAEMRKVPSTADELEEFTGPALLLAQTLEEASQRTQGWTVG